MLESSFQEPLLFFSAICSVFSQSPWLSITWPLTINITHEHQLLVTTSKHLSSYFSGIACLGFLFSCSIAYALISQLTDLQRSSSSSIRKQVFYPPGYPFHPGFYLCQWGFLSSFWNFRVRVSLWAISELYREYVTSGLKCFLTVIYHHPQYIF